MNPIVSIKSNGVIWLNPHCFELFFSGVSFVSLLYDEVDGSVMIIPCELGLLCSLKGIFKVAYRKTWKCGVISAKMFFDRILLKSDYCGQYIPVWDDEFSLLRIPLKERFKEDAN